MLLPKCNVWHMLMWQTWWWMHRRNAWGLWFYITCRNCSLSSTEGKYTFFSEKQVYCFENLWIIHKNRNQIASILFTPIWKTLGPIQRPSAVSSIKPCALQECPDDKIHSYSVCSWLFCRPMWLSETKSCIKLLVQSVWEPFCHCVCSVSCSSWIRCSDMEEQQT